MSPFLKNTFAIVIGVIVGSLINMSIIMVSSYIITPPEGADLSTMEGLKSALPLFEPKHFILPFLAHALGTLSGSLVTALLANNSKLTFALVIGVFFLIGGTINVFMLPAPVWFILLDLVGAYIPMAYIGGKLASVHPE